MPKKGYKQTEEHKEKIRSYRHTDKAKKKMAEAKMGEKNPQWKGDQVGYQAIHRWIRIERPYTKNCEKCEQKNCHTEYANKSGEYLRDINDWIELCVSCHRQMDWDKNPHKGFKLTEDDVRDIFQLEAEGWIQKDIAIRYNVVPSAISQIVNRKRRKMIVI